MSILYFCTMYKWLIVKRKIESCLIFPFVALGTMLSSLFKNEQFSIYFFFPFYHIGGAEKVHYQIVQAFSGKKCIVYFTRKSKGSSLISEFVKAGFEIRDISRYTDNKILYPLNFIYRGIISSIINRQGASTLVFNGQSNFGYKISPWISKKIPQVDLIHALNTFSEIRIPFLQFYTKSVTVSDEIIQKHKILYQRKKVPQNIIGNMAFINYGIELPMYKAYKKKKTDPKKFNILYVGRGSEEKRIYLIAQIAKEIYKIDQTIDFSFAGDVNNYLPKELKKYCNQLGNVTDNSKLDSIYREHDVLIITSSTESGPLVAMEAMARGLIIISTPVGIIKEHVHNKVNGFVFSTTTDEKKIIEEALFDILFLKRSAELCKQIAQTNIEYAYTHFDIQNFRNAYLSLFKSLNPSL